MSQWKTQALRAVAAGALAALVAGCATHPVVLGFAYDRVDDRLADRFASFADFDASQSDWIDARVTHWHHWHRRTQLPRYADFLTSVGTRLGHGPPPSLAEVRAFAKHAEAMYQALARCHPLTETEGLLATLSDAQVDDIANRLAERLNEKERTNVDDRIERTISGLSRLGFRFDEQARAEVAAHYRRAPNIEALRERALEIWSRKLIALLDDRQAPDFDERVRPQMARALSLTRTAYPDAVAANLDSWVRMIHAILADYDSAARADVAERVTALGAALAEISRAGDGPVAAPPTARLSCIAPAIGDTGGTGCDGRGHGQCTAEGGAR